MDLSAVLVCDRHHEPTLLAKRIGHAEFISLRQFIDMARTSNGAKVLCHRSGRHHEPRIRPARLL